VINDDEDLCIAKISELHPLKMLWEVTALTLAEKAGLKTQNYSLKKIADYNFLIVKRFDRRKCGTTLLRIPLASVDALLLDTDKTYLDIARFIKLYCGKPLENLFELYKRICLNILISNTDCHPKNISFLYEIERKSWELSPLYDLIPYQGCNDMKHATLIIKGHACTLDLLLNTCEDFWIKPHEAKAMIEEMKEVVRTWRDVAEELGIPPEEIEKMAPCFKV